MFDYTGKEQSLVAECAGKYKIELWGAGGFERQAGAVGGKGAYTSGIIKLEKDTTLYIYVGEKSTYASGMCYDTNPNAVFNGQIKGTCTAGGGATDIRLVGGQWNNPAGLKSRIMVAAGGGGAFYAEGIGGSGGGLVGYDGAGPSSGTAGVGGCISSFPTCGHGGSGGSGIVIMRSHR